MAELLWEKFNAINMMYANSDMCVRQITMVGLFTYLFSGHERLISFSHFQENLQELQFHPKM